MCVFVNFVCIHMQPHTHTNTHTPTHTHTHIYIYTYIHTHNSAFEAQCTQRAEHDPSLTDRQKKKARDRLALLYKRQASLPLLEGRKVGGGFICLVIDLFVCFVCLFYLFIYLYIRVHICGCVFMTLYLLGY
jgi:hypothetical protein